MPKTVKSVKTRNTKINSSNFFVIKKEFSILILYVTTIALSFASCFVEEKKAFFERNKHLDGHVEYFALTSPDRELISVDHFHTYRMGWFSMQDEDEKTEKKRQELIETRDVRKNFWNGVKKEMPSGSYLVKCKFEDFEKKRSLFGHIQLFNGKTKVINGGNLSFYPEMTEFSIK